MITTQSKKELEEEMLLVKEAMEFEEVLENPEESPEDEVAEDGEGGPIRHTAGLAQRPRSRWTQHPRHTHGRQSACRSP